MLIPKPIKILPKENYVLHLIYEDGTSGDLDLSHLAGKGIFQYWNDYENFMKVYIDRDSNAIAWSEEIDICPDNAYFKINNLNPEKFLSTKDAFSK